MVDCQQGNSILFNQIIIMFHREKYSKLSNGLRLLVMPQTITSKYFLLYELLEMTKTGLILVDERSENGKGTSTISPRL